MYRDKTSTVKLTKTCAKIQELSVRQDGFLPAHSVTWRTRTKQACSFLRWEQDTRAQVPRFNVKPSRVFTADVAAPSFELKSLAHLIKLISSHPFVARQAHFPCCAIVMTLLRLRLVVLPRPSFFAGTFRSTQKRV